MKTELTREQSQHLIDLGVPKEKASGKHIVPQGKPIVSSVGVLNETTEIYPIFKLEDFLNGEVLPKEIFDEANYPFRMESWFVEGTPVWDVQYVGIAESFIQAEELIDALYQLTCWYYKTKRKDESNTY